MFLSALFFFICWKAILKGLYNKHEPRLVLQCSNGTEFKGAVKILEKYFIIKIICSSTYHLHSKIKVEIGNTTFHGKTKFNLMQSVGHGGIKKVKEVKELPEYQRVLNDNP